MKWTVLVDNRTNDSSLETEHGLSILLETEKPSILLDTGASDMLIRNAERLGKDLSRVEYVFISHGHSDHAGGLKHFMQINKKAKVIVSPDALSGKFYSKRRYLHSITTEWPEIPQERLLPIEQSESIGDDIYIITHIPQIHPTPEGNQHLLMQDAQGQYIQDDFRHELALYTGGLLFTGCAHNGLENILAACPLPVNMVVGGFHLLDNHEGEAKLTDLSYRLTDAYPQTQFYTSHCTGDQVFAILQGVMGNRIHPFSCGTTICNMTDNIRLVPVTPDDKEQFILDSQRAFKYGAQEDFGMRDDRMSKTWKIDPEGVLTILPGFRKTKGQPDFYALRDEIKAIVVEEGVHEIGDDWFCYLHEVREISFPSTLRRIGKSAFLGCEKLAEVILPEGVEELAESAFQDCTNVRRFCLPASLRRIGFLALHVGDGRLLSVEVGKGNKHFTSKYGVLYNHDMTAILHYPCAKRRNKYTIPENVTTIADDCFSHARHLEHITLPDGLTQLGGSAFAFCKKLKRMHIPDGVRVIPSYAFFCCESLTELQLPERMEGLGAEAFTFCPLTEFRIPQGVTMLDYAVLANTHIREITIPEGVTEINNSAFYECRQLQKVVLPNSLQSIWEKAFRYCSALTEMEIPSDVWHITDDVFEGCTSLRRIILHTKVIDSLCWVPKGVDLIKQFND